jgi:putative ABC transport system substrate-binding protein
MGVDMRRRDFVNLVCSALLAPCVARAQQPGRVPKIGVLWHAGSEQEEAIFLGALRQGFRDRGYIEGKNIIIETASQLRSTSDFSRLPRNL